MEHENKPSFRKIRILVVLLGKDHLVHSCKNVIPCQKNLDEIMRIETLVNILKELKLKNGVHNV